MGGGEGGQATPHPILVGGVGGVADPYPFRKPRGTDSLVKFLFAHDTRG